MRRLLLALLLCLPIASRAQADSATQGIKIMRVDIDASFLDTVAIRATLELRLRQAGLHVVAPSSHERIDALLILHADATSEGGDDYPVFVRMSVSRRVYLHPAANAASTIGKVWDRELYSSNQWDILKPYLETGVDLFLNEWLAMNPRVASR